MVRRFLGYFLKNHLIINIPIIYYLRVLMKKFRSAEISAEILAEILAKISAEILAEISAEILADISAEISAKISTEISADLNFVVSTLSR